MNMKTIAPLLLVLLSLGLCYAESPQVLWEKYFDGPESEMIQDLELAPEGDFVLCGDVLTVDSMVDNRQYFTSVPFLLKTDAAGNTLWHHYYPNFWDTRGDRIDLKILSVADSGVVLSGKKKNTLAVYALNDGSLRDLPADQSAELRKRDETAVSFFSWEISEEYRPERRPGGGPRIVDSLDYRFLWTGANRELISERTITLQWRPLKYHQFESGDIIVLGIARQPVTDILPGINAVLWLNADRTTRWMKYYHQPDEINFWPDGELVCTPDQRVFVFSNPRLGENNASFHIVELSAADGALLNSHGFEKERLRFSDYLALPENEFVICGSVFQMLPDNRTVDLRRNDFWLMKLRLP
ncbi:hypothetical protein KKC97_12375 [bacterium]|nr:hypothetical protein [bacterium]MBU1638452.1 hypothetical protein [bacterium]